ncbi:hypothetical protein [Aureibacillus halotolerans]|uniref:Uncharacterized protein n=1 Tax=Aureibacillus halotolerans TaxID=1508390 RepID=A0A4R6U8J2_9BACI|nr:hypothetical protein [Aureibacillus halotolerans]TDQ42900.1 hypothetical protein EV213_101330 [Aureibacillus halotolerans]
MTINLEEKTFLETQIDELQKRDNLLAQIEQKLYAMRDLAALVHEGDLSADETDLVNEQFQTLKEEVHLLEQQLHTVIH